MTADLHFLNPQPDASEAMEKAVFKLPKAVKALVAEIAAGQSKSEGAIYREAMAEYLTRRGYNR